MARSAGEFPGIDDGLYSDERALLERAQDGLAVMVSGHDRHVLIAALETLGRQRCNNLDRLIAQIKEQPA